MRIRPLLLALATFAVLHGHGFAQDTRVPRQFDLSPDTVRCIRLDDEEFGPTLRIELTDLGRSIVTAITTTRLGEAVPMVFEGVELARPVVREPITGENVVISSGDSEDWPMERLTERLDECSALGDLLP